MMLFLDNNEAMNHAPNCAKCLYSKVSIIRPDRSRLLEFEQQDSTGHLIETF